MPPTVALQEVALLTTRLRAATSGTCLATSPLDTDTDRDRGRGRGRGQGQGQGQGQAQLGAAERYSLQKRIDILDASLVMAHAHVAALEAEAQAASAEQSRLMHEAGRLGKRERLVQQTGGS